MSPETAQLRSDLADLTDSANADLATLWRQVATAAAAQTALFDILPHIVQQYGTAFGTVAAIWYDDLRQKRGVPGHFSADPSPIDGDLGSGALVGWASSKATAVVQDGAVTPQFQTLIEGGLQRRLTNVARHTIMRATVRDPRSEGWARVGNPKCQFCKDLIGRGAVYRSESSADFPAHDGCHCAAEPEWR